MAGSLILQRLLQGGYDLGTEIIITVLVGVQAVAVVVLIGQLAVVVGDPGVVVHAGPTVGCAPAFHPVVELDGIVEFGLSAAVDPGVDGQGGGGNRDRADVVAEIDDVLHEAPHGRHIGVSALVEIDGAFIENHDVRFQIGHILENTGFIRAELDDLVESVVREEPPFLGIRESLGDRGAEEDNNGVEKIGTVAVTAGCPCVAGRTRQSSTSAKGK